MISIASQNIAASSNANGCPFEGYGSLLSTRDLEEILEVCPNTARALCANGKVPAVKIGAKWYVSAARLAEMMGV